MIDEVLSTELGMVDEALPICNVYQNYEIWLLDFGASHHMSPHRNWYISYQDVNDSSVFMGSCQTVGIENIIIEMYDDIVITLNDLRNVPELRKNLFGSIGL